MKILLSIVLILLGLGALLAFIRSRVAQESTVTPRDIPEILQQLQHSAGDGHFAVLIFVPQDSKDGEAVNLQYSIDHGEVGFDWVLIGPRNIADQKKVSEVASKLGQPLEERDENQVRYLRTTHGNLAELGDQVLQVIYGMRPDSQLGLITEGFDWQPSR